MVISDEKVESILETMRTTMEQLCDLQKENSDLHKEMMTMLKSGGGFPQHKPSGDFSAKQEDDGEKRKRFNRPKPIRPIIEEGVDDFGWNLFIDKWERYKLTIGLENDEQETCSELRESCSPEVNRMLFEFIGADELRKKELTEEALLNNIKSVAVRSIHQEVHRWRFNQIAQCDSEKVTKFVGRLKAQAILCDFNVSCACGKRVSYAEEMVSQRLTTGVINPEHQSKVLCEAEQLNTLKLKVDKLISLETTDEASSKIRTPLSSRSNPIKTSQYKRDQKQKLVQPVVGEDTEMMSRGRTRFRRPPSDRRRRCRGCGRSDHPNNKSMARHDCPAWGQKCKTCGKENHFEKVCERRSRASFAGDTSGSEEDFFTEDEDEGLSDFTDNEVSAASATYDYAARSQDFCLCHPPGQRK